MKLSEIDITLSIKLGDPVTENGDGSIFTKINRVKYIERAYARLKRILPKLMLKETPLFAKIPIYEKLTFNNDENKKGQEIITNRKTITIQELYAIIGGESFSASYINPNNYISVKNGKNSEYAPSIETKEIYYTTINNSIYLLPQDEKNRYEGIEIVYIPDSESISYSDLEKVELNIPLDYIDLLITMAATEGMQDIARQDKVQLYNSDVVGQLNILTQYSNVSEQRKGADVSG